MNWEAPEIAIPDCRYPSHCPAREHLCGYSLALRLLGDLEEKWVPAFLPSHSCGLELAAAVVQASAGSEIHVGGECTDRGVLRHVLTPLYFPFAPWDYHSPLYLVLCKDKHCEWAGSLVNTWIQQPGTL